MIYHKNLEIGMRVEAWDGVNKEWQPAKVIGLGAEKDHPKRTYVRVRIYWPQADSTVCEIGCSQLRPKPEGGGE